MAVREGRPETLSDFQLSIGKLCLGDVRFVGARACNAWNLLEATRHTPKLPGSNVTEPIRRKDNFHKCLTFMEVTPRNGAAIYGFRDKETAIFIDENNYQVRFEEGNAMVRVLTDGSLADSLVKEGLRTASRVNWDESASVFETVLRRIDS